MKVGGSFFLLRQCHVLSIFLAFSVAHPFSAVWFQDVFGFVLASYNDLNQGHPKFGLVRESPPKWP